MYNQLIVEGYGSYGWRRVGNSMSWAFWGYGVGFWRLVSWIVLAYLAFTMIYLASPDRSRASALIGLTR